MFIRVGVLTVSDRCYSGVTRDTSGEYLEKTINSGDAIPNAKVVIRTCVPDDGDKIKAMLLSWVDVDGLEVIFTTGGTGLGERDITPEVTKGLLDKEAIGMTAAILYYGLKCTTFSMLSRPVCGVRKKTLIISFPGSRSACEEYLSVVSEVIPHAVDVIRGNEEALEQHKVNDEGVQPLRDEKNMVHPEKSPNVHLEKYHHHGKSGHHFKASHHDKVGHHERRDRCTNAEKEINVNRRAGEMCKSEQSHDPMVSCITSLCVGAFTSKVKVPAITKRNRESPYPMVTVEKAVSCILDHIVPNKENVDVLLNDSLTYILSSDVYAEDNVPPFMSSRKDGYAVLCADGDGKRRVVGSALPGYLPSQFDKLQNGECIRITTGAPLPPNADAVVQVEDTTLLAETDDGDEEKEIMILVRPKKGQDIRNAGSDISKGKLVLSAGTELRSSELGVLSAIGRLYVRVYRKPKILVVSTGNELQPFDQKLEVGKIRDSNKTTILAILRENGFHAVDCGIVCDDPDKMLSVLYTSLAAGDVLITTGSVSMGECDILTEVLTTDLGVKIHFGRVNMKPGKPTKFGTATMNGHQKYVFALPGNPVSAIVTCHVFVIPAIKALSGYPNPLPTILKAELTRSVNLDDRYEFRRATIQWLPNDPIPKVTPLEMQESSNLVGAISARCLLLLPSSSDKNCKQLEAGDYVDTQIIGRI